MNVRVQLFSRLKEIANTGAVQVEVPEGASVRELLAELYRRFPAFRPWDKTILVGAGVEFVGREYVIQASDDIAIMPPVQGG